MAHDSNGMEGMRNVKTHLCGCSDFPVTLEWRDKHDSLAGFCAPGDDESQGLHLSSMVAAQRLLRSGCRAKLRIAKQLAQKL